MAGMKALATAAGIDYTVPDAPAENDPRQVIRLHDLDWITLTDVLDDVVRRLDADPAGDAFRARDAYEIRGQILAQIAES